MKKYLSIALIALIFVGCGAKKPIYRYEIPLKYSEVFTPLYDENVTSVLILPAQNRTSSADANKFSTDFILPILAESGYYVYSPILVDEYLKSITNSKSFRDIPLEKLREIFNPDAILYTDINGWSTSRKFLRSSVFVLIEYQLRSAKTDKLLWARRALANSRTDSHLNVGSIFGILFSTALSAIISGVNASSDKQKLAIGETYEAYFGFPVAKYHYDFPKEKNSIYGTLRVSESNIDFHKKWLIKHPKSKLTATVYADKKLPGKDKGIGFFFRIDTDKDGNIIEKNGLPILRGGIYENDEEQKLKSN